MSAPRPRLLWGMHCSRRRLGVHSPDAHTQADELAPPPLLFLVSSSPAGGSHDWSLRRVQEAVNALPMCQLAVVVSLASHRERHGVPFRCNGAQPASPRVEGKLDAAFSPICNEVRA
jgi:hypothetical protein